MGRDQIRPPSLPEAFTEVLTDLVDLFRKELRLARAEITSNVSAKLRAGMWLGIAGLLGVAAFALALGAGVSWITTFDFSLHTAFLIVSAGAGLLAVIAYFVGRNEARTELAPSKTINQVKLDIETTKEQLT